MQICVHGIKKTSKWRAHVLVAKSYLVSSIHALVKLNKKTTKWCIHARVAYKLVNSMYTH